MERILYIIRIDQLDSLEENVAFLCIGAKKAMNLHISQDLILIRDYVNLATLFNKVSSIFDQFNRGLLRLMEFDNKNGTSYVFTLKTFADAKYNVTHAAELLYIHGTTLLKHLKKIVDLTDLDLGDWTTRVHLALSFQLLEK